MSHRSSSGLLRRAAVLAGTVAAAAALAASGACAQPRSGAERTPAARGADLRPQPRPHGSPVAVEPRAIRVDDGDTAEILGAAGEREVVRILGIDTPETRHPEHDLPYGQAFGEEARGFARGAFATATRVELLRAATLDPYGRTLGYFFLDGRNYSVLVVQARLAVETVTRYGDNGLPNPAAEVLAAAKAAGPVPFESPADYRQRMRAVSQWMKSKGIYPEY